MIRPVGKWCFRFRPPPPGRHITFRSVGRRPGFGVGRYALAVSFDSATQIPSTRLESVLQGPYDTWSGTDVANLLVGTGPASTPPLHNTPATAIPLTTLIGTGALPTYQLVGTLQGVGAADYYQIVAPNSTGPVVLSVAVSVLRAHAPRLQVQLFDSLNQPVSATVLVNDGGTYSIQAVGLTLGQTYYLRVSTGASDPEEYALTVDFNQPPMILPPVSTVSPTAENTLFVAKSAYFRFSLSTAMGGPGQVGSSVTVQMTILDATGQTVLSLSANSRRSTASAAVLLLPGQYTVLFTGSATELTGPINFTVSLVPLSDPIDPQLSDMTSVPLYQDPVNPSQFLYPTGMVTQSFYYWVPTIF